jgi:hypothetical protein
MSNTRASLLLDERRIVGERAFVELVVWQLPRPQAGSVHGFKYRLAYVVEGRCVLRYDNETGKGDHRHIGDTEEPYDSSTPERLLADFWRDVDAWRP